MKKIKYILFSLIVFFLCSTSTNAYSNWNTYYNVDISDYNTILNKNCGSENILQVVNDLIENTDFDNTYYDLYITLSYEQQSDNPQSLMFFLIPKNHDENKFKIVGQNISSNKSYVPFQFIWDTYKGSPYYYIYYSISLNINSCPNDLTTSTPYQAFVSTLNYNTYNNYPDIRDSQSMLYYSGDAFHSTYNSSLVYPRFDYSLDNNTSYNITSNWFYFSSIDFTFNNGNESNQLMYKTIHLNDNNTDYAYNDNKTIPSYYDIHNYTPPTPEPDNPTFLGYKSSLDTFYTNLSPSDKNNYSLSVNFRVPQSILGSSQLPQEYIDNTSFNYICSGRVNNSNYYTYDTFNCSLSESHTLTNNTITYTFNNLTTSQNLSNYDKIFVTINSNYLDSNVNTTVFDLNYTYNYGSFYNTSYKGNIYDNFNTLPLNFRMYLSSNNSIVDSSLYVRKYNFINYNIKYRGFSNVTQQQNMVIGNSILASNVNQLNGNINTENDFIKTELSNNIDTGIMIFQENSGIVLPSLQLFFNSGVVISINNTSGSNDFYYVDSSGSITHNDFIISHIEDNNNYDISYYINVVSSFIDDLSEDSLEIATLTQSFYNNIPTLFQTFIFVIFVLFCIYFTYLLIRK